jgi:hypothetical protein
MLAENPLALSYILPGDVFFLPADRSALATVMPEAAEAPSPEKIEEPVVVYTAAVTAAPVAGAGEAIIPQIPPMVPTVAPAIAETPAIAFNYTGGYQQKFLILVHYPNHDVMEPGHLSALESTIKRRELSMDDIAIFNISKYPGTELKAIGKFFKPKRMLLLGKDAFPMGLVAPVFNQLTMLGTCQLLYSYSFGDMMGNKENTKAFWERMKML